MIEWGFMEIVDEADGCGEDEDENGAFCVHEEKGGYDDGRRHKRDVCWCAQAAIRDEGGVLSVRAHHVLLPRTPSSTKLRGAQYRAGIRRGVGEDRGQGVGDTARRHRVPRPRVSPRQGDRGQAVLPFLREAMLRAPAGHADQSCLDRGCELSPFEGAWVVRV
eukprot:TRINITY_DN9474_c0_g2_i2.p4 TRINITY_DN9474_c0_g2~~TRINITY_DN9474_c0_g2_i2.p4  ORF type:complete len:163 (-),score=5.16 TRINITY_DN9474_c0_g2_i2:1355-1843(-)